jgi:glycosyltransferase involved in cell wall biosynthesis
MRIYVYTPQFFLRPSNSDWLATRVLTRLPEFNPRVEVYLQQSLRSSLTENLRKAFEIARSRFRLPIPLSLLPKQESNFSLRDVRLARPDFIYGQSPANILNIPVVFNCGATHPAVLRQIGESEEFIRREIDIKRACAARATLVVSHSLSNLENLARIMPEHVEKMRCLPFFLPQLEQLPEAEIQRKFSNIGEIQCLFVGRESRRKALPEVLAAFQDLAARFPGRLRLRIVTNFADGPVEIPARQDVELLGELPGAEVRRLLERSHLLIVPSHYESYGWVYLEAMAAGCIPVAARGATQIEMLAGGRAGITVAADPAQIRDALFPYLLHPEALLPLALNSSRRCRDEYVPGAVARQFEAIGSEAIERFRAQSGRSSGFGPMRPPFESFST